MTRAAQRAAHRQARPRGSGPCRRACRRACGLRRRRQCPGARRARQSRAWPPRRRLAAPRAEPRAYARRWAPWVLAPRPWQRGRPVLCASRPRPRPFAAAMSIASIDRDRSCEGSWSRTILPFPHQVPPQRCLVPVMRSEAAAAVLGLENDKARSSGQPRPGALRSAKRESARGHLPRDCPAGTPGGNEPSVGENDCKVHRRARPPAGAMSSSP